MTDSLILTFIGHDRPGLVSAISDRIAAAGGNWLESRLAHLAGEFAGIILVRVPQAQAMALTTALQGLAAEGLAVTVTQGSGAPAQGETLNLEIIGQDRPGIVRDLTQALTKLGVNIEELSSAIESAPFTGETMFRATLRLGVPEHVAVERIRQTLEVLADEIMVDVKAGAEAV